MIGDGKKRTLVVLRRSPYGSSLAKASIDVALAAAAFEQAVDVLFLGDGVLQLHPGQDSLSLGVKNIGRQLAALPLYDIHHVYVDREAVARHALDLSTASLEICLLDPTEVRELMLRYDHLLGF